MNEQIGKKLPNDRAYAVAVLLEKIVREAYEDRLSSSVQPLQWSILRYLGSEAEERCTIRWISSFLGVTHAPVVRSVQTLQKRNFVTQIANPADARSRFVRLTDDGWNQLDADPLHSVAHRIDGLEDGEKRALMVAVKQLIARQAGGEDLDDVLYPSD